MQAVVWRFYEQGMSIASITEKSAMPPEFIEAVIQEHAGSGQNEQSIT
jgi:hypothetical protein